MSTKTRKIVTEKTFTKWLESKTGQTVDAKPTDNINESRMYAIEGNARLLNIKF